MGYHSFWTGRLPPDQVHTEKSFRNLVESTRNQIVFTISRLIWNQTDVRLIQNQSEYGKYNLISVRLNKISKKMIVVYFFQSGTKAV